MKAAHFLLISLLLSACSTPSRELKSAPTEAPVSLEKYWYSGLAELTSYELEQARYGELRKGTAVTIFVTEPFSKSKHVKLDDYRAAGDDKISVLKMNLTKNFLTGIYPYSIMLSTFTPMDGSRMLKSTMSSQEWCGHTFFQTNKLQSGYQWTGRSYFESEGDQTDTIDNEWTEDELWTQIRLNPEGLPIGKITLLPSTVYLRLRHQPVEAVAATALLDIAKVSDYSQSPHYKYTVDYLDRSLSIYFEQSLPYSILGWEETHMSGFGNPTHLTTRAKRIATIREKYWEKNRNADSLLREALGLSK
jgi:hypothetical protein